MIEDALEKTPDRADSSNNRSTFIAAEKFVRLRLAVHLSFNERRKVNDE
jgi:hypothetical protein